MTNTMALCLGMLKGVNLIILALIIVAAFSFKNIIAVALSLFQLVQAFTFYYITRIQITVPAFVTDRFSYVLSACLFAAGVIADLFILYALKKERNKNQSVFHKIILHIVIFVLPVLLALLVTIDNIIWLYYIILTVMLCTYYVTGYGEHGHNIKSSGYYLVTAITGSTLLLNAIIIMYAANKGMSLNFATQNEIQAVFPAAIFICLSGIVLSGVFPFDGWLLKLRGRKLPLSALNYGIVSVCGISLIFRVVTSYDGTVLPQMLAFAGGFSFAAASVLMNIERNRDLASICFAIAHTGLMLLCMSIKNPAAYTALKLMLLFGIPAIVILFVSEGILFYIDNQKQNKSGQLCLFATIASFIAVLSLSVPPFGAFIARWMLLEASADNAVLFMLIACGMLLNVLFAAKRAATIRRVTISHTANTKYGIAWTQLILLVLIGIILGGGALTPQITAYISDSHTVFADASEQTDVFVVNKTFWLFKQDRLIGGFEPLTILFLLLTGISLLPAFNILKKNSEVVSAYTCGMDMRNNNACIKEVSADTYYFAFDKAANASFTDSIAIKPWVRVIASAIFTVMIGVAL